LQDVNFITSPNLSKTFFQNSLIFFFFKVYLKERNALHKEALKTFFYPKMYFFFAEKCTKTTNKSFPVVGITTWFLPVQSPSETLKKMRLKTAFSMKINK